jgi:dipeptidyl aminopeptidase/acylaminoacyl peptidase
LGRSDDVSGTPFDELGEYMAIPRVAGLRIAPDGTWLAAAVQTLSPDRKKYLTSIWRIDAHGGAARRLTRSATGEASARFLPDGSLLFTSTRPDPGRAGSGGKESGDGADVASLWLLPAGGGEARVVAAMPGGVAAAEVASEAGTVVLLSSLLQGAGNGNSPADDEKLRKARKDAGVSAILHESAPVRYWDHDLGPSQLRLFALDQARLADSGVQAWPDESGEHKNDYAGLRDLTPGPGRALDEQSYELTPDGTAVLTGWWDWNPAGDSRAELVLIDVVSGKRRTLAAEPGTIFGEPKVSPDGRFAAVLRDVMPTPAEPANSTMVLVDLEAETYRDLLPGLDRRPGEAAWAPDGTAVYFAADDNGRRPVFKVDVATGEVTKITTDDAAYLSLNPSPDGRHLFALRAAIDSPPAPVRIDLSAPATKTALDCPGTNLELPGRLEEVHATADDGHPIRSWLVLPHEASEENPAPLLLWVHGGPEASWNAWAWRWNPWLMVAKGYAVLLPDPALSTGYGQDFIRRGYQNWGARPYADIIAATDASEKRPDIDQTRTAMMGGSYGGYMANWMAGHTDRFKAIVSHASLWMLDQMFGTTDMPVWWRGQFGDPLANPDMYLRNSPHLHVANIRTPMLVIHGDKDYRVPIGEGLRLWNDLTSHGVEAKFLYFPDQGHWVLTPGDATVWYQTVFAFLAHHVHGQPWQRPELL